MRDFFGFHLLTYHRVEESLHNALDFENIFHQQN